MKSTNSKIPTSQLTNYLIKFFKISAWIIGILLVGMLSVYGYVNSEAGQRTVSAFVNKYISERVETPFRVGRIGYSLPDWVSASDVYFADQSLDTLLAASKIRIDIDMLDLLNGKISIDEIQIENINANFVQTKASKSFNYQFLIDAFSSTDTLQTVPDMTSSFQLIVDELNVDGLQLSYLDEIGAIDFKSNLQEMHLGFNKIDIDKNDYDLKELILANGFLTLHTDVAQQVATVDESNTVFGFNIEQIAINNVDWAYYGEDVGIKNRIQFDEFGIGFNQIDLANENIDIAEIELANSNVSLQLFPIANDSLTASSTGETSSNWKVMVKDILLKNNKLTYDDLASIAAPKGIDPNHIALSNFYAIVQDVNYSSKQTSLEIDKLQFKDKSSFQIDKFEGKVLFNDQEIRLEDFDIETPQTELDFNTLLTFSSLGDLTNNFEKVKFDLTFNDCVIGIQDVLMLQPTLVNDTLLAKIDDLKIKFDAKLKGAYSDFRISRLEVSGLESTEVLLNGRVKGLNNFEKLQTDLVLKKMVTTRCDIELLMGDMASTRDINIPEELALTGKVSGDGKRITVNADLRTSIGEIMMNGALLNLADSTLTSYEGQLKTADLLINELFKEDYKLGRLSTNLELAADAMLTDVKAKGLISNVFYNGYDFSNLSLNVAMKDSLVNLEALSLDQNFNLETVVELDLKNAKIPARGQIEITNINLKNVNIYDLPDPISGFVKFDMSSTLPESLAGNFESTKLLIGSKKIGASKGIFTNKNGENEADFSSEFLDLKLTTSATYTELSDVIFAEINNYYQLDTTEYSVDISSRNLSLNLIAKNHSIWSTFVSDLSFKKPIVLNIEKSDKGLQTKVDFADLKYLDYDFESFELAMKGNGESLKGLAKLSKFGFGTTQFDKNELEINVANSKLVATYLSKSEKGKEARNQVGFSLAKLADGVQVYLQKLRLEKTDYIINNAPIFANENGIQVNNLVLSKAGENLILDADFQEIALTLNGIDIRPFVDLAGYASYDINGLLFGNIYIEDYMQDYVAKGNIGLKKFIIQGVDNGEVNVLIARLDADQMSIDADIIGKNTNATLSGYLGFQDNLPLDFEMNLQRFDTKLFEQLAPESIKSADGIIAGKLILGGTSEKPNVTGKLGFDKVKINSTYLGTPVRINDQSIQFVGQVVKLENFIILDSLNQKLKLNGKVNWADLDKIEYDLALETKNFLFLDAEKGTNELYYGKANIDANLSIQGIGEKPTIGGNIKVNANSDVTIIMPAEIEDLNGSEIVTFVPPKNYQNPDSTSEAVQSSLENFASLTNEIIIDIETDPKAQLIIVVDEFSGDNIKVKGKANLTAGIYPSGELFLIGVYEIESGSYDFSLEFLKRNFQLEKGGTIIWSGDPYQASIQLQAFYEVNTDIQSLNSLGLNVDSYGKVPIDVLLKIEGTIENPLISFDFRPSARAESSIKSLIENNDIFSSLRKNQSEMNQQVFSLLVFNKFFNDQTVSSSTSINSEAIARQSVSKLLTEQLNMLADDFLGSVGLNFGLNSDQLNTSTGEGFRTNLSVGLNKTFLNDRVKVSVGKNFELENTSGLDQNSAEILDNIEVAYNITPDGRYAVKVYRNNQFQTVLEGFVLETGVSFVLTGDYNSFGELFKKNKAK